MTKAKELLEMLGEATKKQWSNLELPVGTEVKVLGRQAKGDSTFSGKTGKVVSQDKVVGMGKAYTVDIDGKEHKQISPEMLRPVGKVESKNEANASDMVKELINLDWGKDNDSQGKGVQILKGLAFSDDPVSNKFMQALNKFSDTLDPKEFE